VSGRGLFELRPREVTDQRLVSHWFTACALSPATMPTEIQGQLPRFLHDMGDIKTP
jgi:hypothetical protein